MLNYKIVGKQKPGTSDPANLKYYAYLVHPGVITIEGLAKRIASNCTVTRADCLAVLSSLQEQIIYALQSGMRVHLGDVGNFRLNCQSGGSETPEDFSVKQIKKLKVVFSPSKTLKNAITLNNEDISFYNLEGAATGTDAQETEMENQQTGME